MVGVSWTEKKTKLKIANAANSRRKLMSKVKRKQAEFHGHAMTKDYYQNYCFHKKLIFL